MGTIDMISIVLMGGAFFVFVAYAVFKLFQDFQSRKQGLVVSDGKIVPMNGAIFRLVYAGSDGKNFGPNNFIRESYSKDNNMIDIQLTNGKLVENIPLSNQHLRIQQKLKEGLAGYIYFITNVDENGKASDWMDIDLLKESMKLTHHAEKQIELAHDETKKRLKKEVDELKEGKEASSLPEYMRE